MTQPVQTIDVLLAEHAELEHALADPELHSKPDEARKVGRRFARLAPIVATHRKLVSARGDLEAARELAVDDESFAAEVPELESRVAELDTQLTDMLAPRDPHDADDIVLEVKSGEGGEESALFAADLARMYIRYAERHGWTVTVLGETTSDLGGYKDATLTIGSKGDSVDGVWSRMKFEGGVHRVQRVPVTESQGRVHTSAAGVLVYPQLEEVGEVQIDESDLRIDVYRSSGKGGQGVNTTDSAVRITHLPTGIVVTCQNERSQLQNKTRALQVLAARLQALAEEQAQADASADRASQIRTVDRSERIRTYNFPENRIADHRINYKAHNLDQVLDGDMDALFDALSEADKQPDCNRHDSRAGDDERATRTLRHAIDSATVMLTDAGIDSARCDAEQLAAHLAGVDRGRLSLLDPPDEEFFERYREAVTQRSRRVPLQHVTGTAAFGPLQLHVGPGVFIPRPETESLLEWVTAQHLKALPVIVDLCTGSGALAAALAHHRPAARIIAIDDSGAALEYARRNTEGTEVELLRADVTAEGLLPELDGQVDVVVANPPYIPDAAELDPEVAQHDPHHALFGGPDGMRVIGPVVALAGRWLRPGGLFAVEHDDTTSRTNGRIGLPHRAVR